MDAVLYKKIQDGLAPVVKSVQRGTINFTADGQLPKTITINTVDPNKCMVNILGMVYGSAIPAYCKSLTASSLVIASSYGDTTTQSDRRLSWEIIEFY